MAIPKELICGNCVWFNPTATQKCWHDPKHADRSANEWCASFLDEKGETALTLMKITPKKD